MKYIGLLLTVLAVSAVPAAWGASQQPMLVGMQKEEVAGTTRIAVDVSVPVSPKVAISGQRVDLILPKTSVDSGFGGLSEDATLIKTLLIHRYDDLVVSFLFRRPPTRAEAHFDQGRNQVVLQIFWSQAGARQRLAIMPGAPGVPTRSADGSAVSRTRSSEYSGNWRRFFAEYETPFSFDLPPRYSLPPLPLPSFSDIRNEEAKKTLEAGRKEAERGDWQAALEQIRSLLNVPFEKEGREGFLVFYGEALARTGLLSEARATLEVFCEKYPQSIYHARGHYLAGYVRAAAGDPYGAIYETSEALDQAGPSDALYGPVFFLRGEAFLAQKKYSEALDVLSGVELAGTVDDLRLLARGCALAGVGRYEDAIGLFRDLEARYGELRDPYAMEHFARALYRAGKFSAAEAAYARLAKLCAGHPDEGMAYFAQVQAALRQGQLKHARQLLDRVLVAFPESSGGQRAALKQIDLAILDGGEKVLAWAIIDYGRYAEELSERRLREEAAFKQALALHLDHDDRRSVEVLQAFIRKHFSGDLRNEAEALLGDLLPGVISKLISEDAYMEALVMVERNREILLDQRISWDFLKRLAGAYSDMELLHRAARVYLFMLDNNRKPGRERSLYPLLVKTLFDSEQFRLAVEYAEEYRRKYPQGESRAEVLLVQARALVAMGRKEQAAGLLADRARPASRELDLLAGKICFEVQRYAEAAVCLERQAPHLDSSTDAAEVLLLAESLFRADRPREALRYFTQIVNVAEVSDQAIYRCGQIYFQNGEKERALKLFRQLAEEGESALWRKMAREMLELKAMELASQKIDMR